MKKGLIKMDFIAPFVNSICYAPTIGCASLIILVFILQVLAFPFNLLNNILGLVRKDRGV